MQVMLSRESRHSVPGAGQPGPVPGPALSAQSGFRSLSKAKAAGGSLILIGLATSCQQLETLESHCRWCCQGRAGNACPGLGSPAPYPGAASPHSVRPAQQAAASF